MLKELRKEIPLSLSSVQYLYLIIIFKGAADLPLTNFTSIAFIAHICVWVRSHMISIVLLLLELLLIIIINIISDISGWS